jgi:hypothetical protein
LYFEAASIVGTRETKKGFGLKLIQVMPSSLEWADVRKTVYERTLPFVQRASEPELPQRRGVDVLTIGDLERGYEKPRPVQENINPLDAKQPDR